MPSIPLTDLLHGCRRALIIKPSSLGDLVHTLPAVHLLKKQWPQIAFTWLANPAFAPLLEGNPDLDGTVIFPRNTFRGAGGLWRFGRWLREVPKQLQPDVTIDFQGLLRSGLTAAASRAPVRIGFSDSREGARFFQTHLIKVDPAAHATDRSLSLPRFLGIDGPAVFPLPMGSIPAALQPGEHKTLAESQENEAAHVLLHPFSRGAGKSLAPHQVAELCRQLAPLPVILAGLGGPAMPEGLPENTINLLDRTSLPELIWLIRRARCVISVDSGPMHIAAALTSRVLSIHTWSDPRKVGPWHPGTTVWKAGRLMPVEEMDPALCQMDQNFPDAAVSRVAGWAHGIVA